VTGGARFVFVDALRGLAAVAIVVFHLFAATHVEHLEAALPAWLAGALRSAHVAVAVFFALSGFVIAHALGKRRIDARYATRFLVRRLVRLGPPYWASLALAVATASYFPALHPTAPQLAAHVLYLQDVLRVPALSPIYWTLCLELQFYVVVCLVLAAADRLGGGTTRRRAVIEVVAALTALTVTGWIRMPDAHRWFPGLFHAFLAGALAWWALDGTVPRRDFWIYAVVVGVAGADGGNRYTPVAVATAVALLGAGGAGGLTPWHRLRPLQAVPGVT
jgi:peptidoglycan/LPS O-acetylase OafA/YrhL